MHCLAGCLYSYVGHLFVSLLVCGMSFVSFSCEILDSQLWWV